MIALGLILSPQEDPDLLLSWVSSAAPHFREIIVAIDSSSPSQITGKIHGQAAEQEQLQSLGLAKILPPAATVFYRSLQKDFAAQRNAVVKRCKAPWLLMLDTDESLSQEHLGLLPQVLKNILRQKSYLRVLGFPRHNYLDGSFMDIPDPQFRLVKRDVRWRNTSPHLNASPGCHEFPREIHDAQECVGLLDSIIITHSKSRSRQEAQNKFYADIAENND